MNRFGEQSLDSGGCGRHFGRTQKPFDCIPDRFHRHSTDDGVGHSTARERPQHCTELVVNVESETVVYRPNLVASRLA